MLCPNCKAPIPRDLDQLQNIKTLESQVQDLSQKLAYSVDKVADLEDELEVVRRNTPNSLSRTTSTPLSQTSSISEPNPVPSSSVPGSQSRISSFLTSRRPIFNSSKSSSAVLRSLPARTSAPASLSVEEQLVHERSAREVAEEKVVLMTQELEELTQSLFEEANAMVRTEKEKVARLEEKIQILESREEDKRRRLTELEKAIGRITRVRGILENKENKPVLGTPLGKIMTTTRTK